MIHLYFSERLSLVDWKSLSYSGIYRYCNLVDWKVYIGSSIHIRNRNTDALFRGNVLLRRAILKHGEENFEFAVMERLCRGALSKEDFEILILNREQFWMDFYRSYEREEGYNIASIAGSNRGTIWNEESRAKGSEAQRRRFENDEERAKQCIRMQKAQNEPETVRKKSEKAKAAHIRRKATLTTEEYVASEVRRIEASLKAKEERRAEETQEEKEARKARRSKGSSVGWIAVRKNYTPEEIAAIQAEKARLGHEKMKASYTPEEYTAKKSAAGFKAWETRRKKEAALTDEERIAKKKAVAKAQKIGRAKSRENKTQEELEAWSQKHSIATKEGMARKKALEQQALENEKPSEESSGTT